MRSQKRRFIELDDVEFSDASVSQRRDVRPPRKRAHFVNQDNGSANFRGAAIQSDIGQDIGQGARNGNRGRNQQRVRAIPYGGQFRGRVRPEQSGIFRGRRIQYTHGDVNQNTHEPIHGQRSDRVSRGGRGNQPRGNQQRGRRPIGRDQGALASLNPKSLQITDGHIDVDDGILGWLRSNGTLPHKILHGTIGSKHAYCFLRTDMVPKCPFCETEFISVEELIKHLVATHIVRSRDTSSADSPNVQGAVGANGSIDKSSGNGLEMVQSKQPQNKPTFKPAESKGDVNAAESPSQAGKFREKVLRSMSRRLSTMGPDMLPCVSAIETVNLDANEDD